MSRRGKYLWMPLQAAGRQGGLLWHLGMSGSLALVDHPATPGGKHDHFDLVTTAGTLRLTDPRRFGAVVWSTSLEDDPARRLLAKLGPEPFDPALDAASFHAACRQRRTSIKAALLSGALVVGAGNIYACEALFRAGIDPRTRCNRLSRARSERLLQALRLTLSRAIEVGGSTLRDFRDAHGMAGQFQSEALIYGREGQPCTGCGRPVRRIAQAQRSTFFCAHCQAR
jgi:formamidopyrimidine-DNA glycosylase